MIEDETLMKCGWVIEQELAGPILKVAVHNTITGHKWDYECLSDAATSAAMIRATKERCAAISGVLDV